MVFNTVLEVFWDVFRGFSGICLGRIFLDRIFLDRIFVSIPYCTGFSDDFLFVDVFS